MNTAKFHPKGLPLCLFKIPQLRPFLAEHKFISSSSCKNAKIVSFFLYKSRNDFYVAQLRDAIGQTHICLIECHFLLKN